MSGAFSDTIGRSETARDHLTPRLPEQFRALFDGLLHDPTPEVAPLALHWCLCPPAAPQSRLGGDGHPATGDFLPPVPLPRRMWAAGDLRFQDDLRLGDEIRRTSTVRAVDHRHGRTGPMWLVTVEHRLASPRGIALIETQTIVYRPAGAPAAERPSAPIPAGPTDRHVGLDPVRLFRYSALTFNGHRIHYDLPYARDIEGYPGLVAHGPLQATLLLHAAARELGGLRRFTFRATAPLIAPATATIRLEPAADGLRLCLCAEDGAMTMSATAS